MSMKDAYAEIEDENVESFRVLFTSDNINKIDEEGYTPLYYACMKGKVTSTIELLHLGASVDQKGSDGETPFYISCFNNNVELATLLLENGANINAPNGAIKDTALHAVSRFGYMTLLKKLIEKGADLNVLNSRRETPIYGAARFAHHEVVYQLLLSGANALLTNEDGKSPLYIASEKGHKHVAILLKAEPNNIREAKAEADLELANRRPRMMSTSEIEDLMRAGKKQSKQIKRRATQQVSEPNTSPMEVVQIHVPRPKPRTHDPLTGASYGPCRTLEEVGYDSPPPVPPHLLIRPPPEKQKIGGTMMRIGTSTEADGKEPVRIDLGKEEPTQFYLPS